MKRTYRWLKRQAAPACRRAVRRREDLRSSARRRPLYRRRNLPGQVYAVMVRSPHAHARIRSIGTAEAKAAPGVPAVLTGVDFCRRRPQTDPAQAVVAAYEGGQAAHQKRRAAVRSAASSAADDKARFVGEAVAMVVAETVHAAKDGAERIVTTTTSRPRWSKPWPPRARMRRGCTTARIERLLRWRAWRRGGTDAAFARAAERHRSRPGCSASPACRWSRARRSPPTMPTAAATPSTRGNGARCG